MTTLADMIPSVLEKTTARKLSWEELSSGSYIARIGSLSLELSTQKPTGVRLALLDAGGRVLESTTYAELPIGLDDTLINLFGLVRRQALGVDAALDELRSTLNKL